MATRKRQLLTLLIVMLIGFGGVIYTIVAGITPRLGLDLQGGASVTLTPVGDPSDDAIDQAVEIIRNRVDGLGVAEPEIVRQGNAIVVNLPGVDDQQRALEIVGQTAELRFRPVLQETPRLVPDTSTSTTVAGASTTAAGASTTVPATTAAGTTVAPSPNSADTTAAATTAASTTAPAANPGNARVPVPAQATTTTPPTTSSATTAAPTTVAAAPTATIPPYNPVECGKAADADIADRIVWLPQCDGRTAIADLLLGKAFLTGNGVETAEARFNQNTNEWTVSLTLKPGSEGIDPFNEWAAICYQGGSECPASGASPGRIAITLDGEVQSAPSIQAPSFTRDQIQISGNFDQGSASDLALVLRYGALPVQLEPQAVQTVSATLGSSALQAAVIAGAIGVVLVVALLLAYYRKLAIVIPVGLCVSGAYIWTIVCLLSEYQGLTLTLAGAAGLIVSVGVTVDSYVVYLERIKDDVRAGRSLRSSVTRGFKSAWRTILAADFVSLLGAAVLWYFAVGSVRGFAFFLGLATVVDIFVSYFYTRPAVALLATSKRFTGDKRILGIKQGEAVTKQQPAMAGGPR